MNLGFIQFKEQLFAQGLFSNEHIRVYFPEFNKDNLLHWQKKGYILKLRNKWYCFSEFVETPDSHFIIANNIYSPSYISHQQALMFHGLIPEHIAASTSVTTKKTATFDILNRTFKYYSVKKELFFGYQLMPLNINGISRNVMMARKEKCILDLLYLYSFYKNEDDLRELRLNEEVMRHEIDWNLMEKYTLQFNSKTLLKKVSILKKLFTDD